MYCELVLLRVEENLIALFQAPGGEDFKPGDHVIVLWDQEEKMFPVVNSTWAEIGSEKMNFVKSCFDVPETEELPRIVSRVVYEPMRYDG